MRFLVVPAALTLTVLVPAACSSFEPAASADAGPPIEGPEGGKGGEGGAADAPAVDAGRARTLYVFGGVTIDTVAETEETVFDAYAASINDDGSLGPWARAKALDIGRSYPTTIAAPNGLLIIAGGNGMPIGQGASGDFQFYRDDVSVSGGDPLESWKAAPSLGGGNGRRAAPGTYASANAYVGGGIVAGDGFTDTLLAAPFTVAPPTLQPWKQVGTLPSAMADHGLVALGSRLYVIGGLSARDGGVVVSADASMAPIAGDGTVGAWAPTANLPKPLKGFGAIGAEGRVFVIGGADQTDVSASVFIGTQTPTQDLGWQSSTPLTHPREHLCVLRANGRLYAIGGATLSTVSPVVEVGEVSGTSITWRDTMPMPIARGALGCAAR